MIFTQLDSNRIPAHFFATSGFGDWFFHLSHLSHKSLVIPQGFAFSPGAYGFQRERSMRGLCGETWRGGGVDPRSAIFVDAN